MTFCRQCIIVVATILIWSGLAGAWLRSTHEDATVVQRSQLIVVGHLDKDSIQYVPHEKTGDSGASWEYHATLVVTETLKGSVKEKQIPIVINYGLTPLVGGRDPRSSRDLGGNLPDPAFPKDRIDILDFGGRGGCVLADAQKDNLWFLRHLGGELGREEGKGPLGIVDPEDVTALKFKGCFQALLSRNADEGIHRLLSDPDEAVVARALRHLSSQHRTQDATRIARLLSSPNEKVQTLAVKALAEVADVSAVPTFREALGHANPKVRAAACVFLCRFQDTQSIPAIGKVLRDLHADQRWHILADLPRMESREVVDLLLDQLDEHLDPKDRAANPYGINVTAAKALRTLTGIEFPLDTAQARRRWDEFKGFPDEVLLRKSMLEDIETLTSTNYHDQFDAYEALARVANRHLGPYITSANDTAAWEKSQGLWRSWAKENITRPRTDWIYAGFAESGIALPRAMDAKGIDLLIAVLELYGDVGVLRDPPSRPSWVKRGLGNANLHRENANRLLEQATGYKVGITVNGYDLLVNERQNVLAQRWAAWWKENRDTVTLRPLPEEKPVTADMLAKVPSLRLPPGPLALTIRPKSEVHVFRGKEPLTILVEVKNVSLQDVLVTQRPGFVEYTCSMGSGGQSVKGPSGMEKGDYVTLKPGQAITWEQTDIPSVDNLVTPISVENLQYELIYYNAGSQFGLHTWRGKLLSNRVNCRVEAKK